MPSNDQNQPGGATPAYLTAHASVLCVTGAPQVLKATAGTVVTVSVLTPGAATGAIYDAATTGSTAGKQVGVIPMTSGVVKLEFPCLVGIVVAPGSGQTVSVSYA